MESEERSAIPASIEAAWGLRARPQKGPKRGLTLDGVVAAAVAVADAEGLDSVSMGRVAKELGASTMALYRYVATKDELLMLMTDAAAGPLPALPPAAEGDWRAGLRHWYLAMRAAMFAHPWTVPLIPAGGPPVTPNQLAWLDQALYILRGTPLSAFEKVAVALLVSSQVRSEVAIGMSMGANPDADRLNAEYNAFLLRVTGSGRLPSLHALAEEGAFDQPPPGSAQAGDASDEFAFGLERVLDGIEAYLESQTR